MTVAVDDSQSILVVSPWLVLMVALMIVCTDVFLHLCTPWLRLRLTTTSAQRASLRTHAHRIAQLRVQSNQLNSPATFAEYAKVQRTLQKELKAQQQLQAEIGANAQGGATPIVAAAQQFALSHGAKFLVYIICFLVGVGNTLFIVPAAGWMKALAYTPVRVGLPAHARQAGQMIRNAHAARTLSSSSFFSTLSSSVLSPLPSPLSCQLLLGEVGIIPWLVVCSTVTTAIKTWL